MKHTRASLACDLISSFEQSATHEWRATLHIDRSDRFFFDHELDHIPGMALVEACLQLVEHSTAFRDTSGANELYFATVSFEFQRFCEHGAPTQLCVKTSKVEPSHWQVQVVQDGLLVTSGTVVTRPVAGPPSDATTTAVESCRADRALVHKVKADNVLIGPMTLGADSLPGVQVVAPKLRDAWAGRSRDQRSAGELIEAGRQFGNLLVHSVAGMPFDDRQFVLQHFSMVLDRPVYRSEPVEICGRPGLLIRHLIHGVKLVRASGRVVGHLDFRALLLPHAVYARLRKNARAELDGSSQQYAANQRSA